MPACVNELRHRDTAATGAVFPIIHPLGTTADDHQTPYPFGVARTEMRPIIHHPAPCLTPATPEEEELDRRLALRFF